ncbi:DNA alkylation repair protein [Dyadobacter diqingensis]|uniref:DNA alkylation repair protein n=1 Tax=Dyadobacter diqingensis TaxID=2938121 RepID=UPI0020C1BD48|nr:DNA alkylation repair protein [Dyadobacter diqingensis]
MHTNVSAAYFTEKLYAMQSPEELVKIQRYFKSGEGQYGEGDVFIGVRMGNVFSLAKEFIKMPTDELEKLLESPVHELRTGALSIMNQQARSNKMPEADRKALYDLYLRRHDRINNWDLVDLSCIYVIGKYLNDKPRDILYQLAVSENMWERRTAMVSTAYFLKHGDLDDTFNIAEILLNDSQDLIHKAAGGWLRQAGKSDRVRLISFLDRYAATMPRTFLRYAIEHLSDEERRYYLNLKNK